MEKKELLHLHSHHHGHHHHHHDHHHHGHHHHHGQWLSNEENWDKFYTERGQDDRVEWYAEWAENGDMVLSHLSGVPLSSEILVPGCGYSRLSEHLYDAGYHSITNIDFSQVAISNMSRRNARQRPHMRWRVMDMAAMQFMDETFDAVVDKGGFEALLEAEDPMLANQYFSEMKRVTKTGGKFICFTFGETPVLDVMLSKLRFGWKTSIVAVPHRNTSSEEIQSYPYFMVAAEKAHDSAAVHQLLFSLPQGSEVEQVVMKENIIRANYSEGEMNEVKNCVSEAAADQKLSEPEIVQVLVDAV